MLLMPPVTAVPNAASHIRGIINLRGEVLPLVDLRTRCGMESLSQHIESLCAMLQQREQDHKNWLAELEKSVKERRPFTLGTDPHKCAFGKWYDHFHTDDLLLSMILKKFDEPHKAIHALGHKIEDAKQRQDFTAAAEMIEHGRATVLHEMLDVFASLRHHLSSATREIALVVKGSKGESYAIAADRVDCAESLPQESVTPLPSITAAAGNRFITGVAKRKKDNHMILLLDVGALYGEDSAVAKAA
jgi:purine-binding chemotaxis protein CheW